MADVLQQVADFFDTTNPSFRKAVYFVLLLIALVLHEFAHAITALWFGDKSVRHRVTLNPLKHLDPLFSVGLPLLLLYQFGVVFGAGRPVPVEVDRLRFPNLGMTVISAAGPAMNVLIAAVSTVVLVGLVEGGAISVVSYTSDLLWTAIKLNLLLAAFNMLPVPPLDGHRVLGFFLPRPVRERFYRMWWLGLILLLLMFFQGGFGVFHDEILSPIGKWWMRWMPEGAGRLFPSGWTR